MSKAPYEERQADRTQHDVLLERISEVLDDLNIMDMELP